MFFSNRIKELRILHNISQVELAKKINKSARQIRNYESGSSEPTSSVLIKLSSIFSVSTDYILGITDNPEINK